MVLNLFRNILTLDLQYGKKINEIRYESTNVPYNKIYRNFDRNNLYIYISIITMITIVMIFIFEV